MAKGRRKRFFLVLLTACIVLCLKTGAATAASLGPYSNDADTVLLMHFDEGKGLPGDGSGYQNNANNTTAAWTPDGKFGAALQFDGVNNKVSIPYNKNLGFAGKLTCEAWIKSLGSGGNIYQTIVSIPGEFILALSSDRRMVFVHNWDLKPADLYANFNGFLDAGWHHVAFAYDGITRSIYIDGELKSSDTPSGSIVPGTQGTVIGYWYAGTGFNGLIDEVRISKAIRNFSSSETTAAPLQNTNRKPWNNQGKRHVIALSMGEGWMADGPVWETQVDRVLFDFSLNKTDNQKGGMLQAKNCGIEAFPVNTFVGMAGNGAQLKRMADLAQEVGFKIIPLPEVSSANLGVRTELTGVAFEGAIFDLKETINTLVEHPAVLRDDAGKMIIIVDSADFTPFSAWEKIFSRLDAECGNNMAKVVFVAHLRNINAGMEKLRKYLQLGFRGFYDLYGSDSTLNLRDVVDSVVPDGKGIVITSMSHNFYWRVEYGTMGHKEYGTETLRKNWENVNNLPINMVNLCSWNDFCENHHFQPSHYLGRIRGEITKHYAALMNNQTPPAYNDFHLYCSFPRSLLAGQILNLELLNFPNNQQDYSVSCQIRSPTGNLLKEFNTPAIRTSALQAFNFEVPTGSFPRNTRVVEIWNVLRNKERKTLLEKKVGFVIVEPIINQNFLAISRLITDIPDVDIAVQKNKDTVKLASQSKTSLRDIHLHRSDFIPVKYSPDKRTFVKMIFAGASSKNNIGQVEPTSHQVLVSVVNGKLINASPYANGPMGESVRAYMEPRITKTDGRELKYSFAGWGMPYPDGIILELGKKADAPLKILLDVDGDKVTIPVEELKNKNISYVNNEQKVVGLVSLTDEDPHIFKPSEPNERLLYRVNELALSSNMIWRRRPVEVFFGRATDNDRRWVDSSPIIINRSGVQTLVEGYAFDREKKERFPITFFENENLIAFWDFNNVTETGLIPSQSEYDFPALLGGKSDLSFPYNRFSRFDPLNEQKNPKIVSDGGRRVAKFDGKKNFVYGPTSIFPPGAFHLTTLIKPDRTDGEQSIFSDKRFGGAMGIAALYLLPGGPVQGQVHTSGRWVDINSQKALNTEKWYRIELIYDLKEIRLLIDSRLENKIDLPAKELYSGAHPVIGAEETNGDYIKYFAGCIAYVKIEAFVK